MDTCIICKGENPITEENPLTDEHIIPEFIGGNLVQKNVCKICNDKIGGHIEGPLAKSLFYELPRYIHNIEGKKNSKGRKKSKDKSNLLDFPLSGVYEDERIGKFCIDDSANLKIIPNVDVKGVKDKIIISESMDKSEDEKTLLMKALSRYFKTQGQNLDKKDLSKLIDRIINGEIGEVNKQNVTVEKPRMSRKIDIDLHAQVMLYMKIAYELAVFHFGNSYIDDSIANKLRLVLKNQKVDDITFEKFLSSKHDCPSFFNDEYHWVSFDGNVCFIKFFGLAGTVEYTESNSAYCIPDIFTYRFCYKSLNYKTFCTKQLLFCSKVNQDAR